MYSYLTGSASWFVFTLLTRVFGVRGEYGDLVIEPQLAAAQFQGKNTISLKTAFLKRNLEIRFLNPQQKEFGRYRIRQAKFNGKLIKRGTASGRILISRREFLALTGASQNNIIEINLG